MIQKKPSIIKPLLLLFLALFSQYETYSQVWNEIVKLNASEPVYEGLYGISVSVSCNTAAVGAMGDGPEDLGAVYIYEKTGEVWTEFQKIRASDEGSGFGNYVDVSESGTRIIVGSPNDSDDGFVSGAVYVFDLIGGVWTESVKLSPSDGAAFNFFGEAISISGDRIIVGASGNDVFGDSAGSAYIFELIDGSWTEVIKLTPSDAAEDDFFGEAVAISGELAIVGAFGDEDDGGDSGSTYVFELVDGVWTETAKLTASDADAGDFFGRTVSMSDSKLVISSWTNSDAAPSSGSVYIFELVDDVWTETAKLNASDAATDDDFGYSLDISGNRLIVGARYNSDDGFFSGSVYIFDLIDGVWTESEKLTASDADELDVFGHSSAISGNTAIIGAFGDDDEVSASGSAYIFSTSSPTGIAVSHTAYDELIGEDGAIDITVVGGIPDYTFDWDIDGIGDFDDDEDLTDLDGGTYTVVIKDNIGCTASETIVIDSQVGIDDFQQLDLAVYPNPFSDFTRLSFGETLKENHTVIIHNVLGEEVYRNQNVTGNSLEIKKSELEVGLYVLSFLSPDSIELFSTKLIVQ